MACVGTLGHICLHPDGFSVTLSPEELLNYYWTGPEKLQEPLYSQH